MCSHPVIGRKSCVYSKIKLRIHDTTSSATGCKLYTQREWRDVGLHNKSNVLNSYNWFLQPAESCIQVFFCWTNRLYSGLYHLNEVLASS